MPHPCGSVTTRPAQSAGQVLPIADEFYVNLRLWKPDSGADKVRWWGRRDLPHRTTCQRPTV